MRPASSQKALRDGLPDTRERRGFVHKSANVAELFTKVRTAQGALALLHEIGIAETHAVADIAWRVHRHLPSQSIPRRSSAWPKTRRCC